MGSASPISEAPLTSHVQCPCTVATGEARRLNATSLRKRGRDFVDYNLGEFSPLGFELLRHGYARWEPMVVDRHPQIGMPRAKLK